jgi:hypothetical protein
MTRRDTSSASLDEVLARYASQASDFNPEALQRLIDEYPQHADALRRYAHVQLISVPATPEEIEREDTPDHELLPMQSKLLLRMQQLRAKLSPGDLRDAQKKLGAIKGSRAIHDATRAVFGGTESGEPSLFLCVIDPPGVKDAPEWFSETLATHMESSVAAVQIAITRRQSGRGVVRLQMFSARERPKDAQPRSWLQAVAENITDATIRERILRRR